MITGIHGMYFSEEADALRAFEADPALPGAIECPPITNASRERSMFSPPDHDPGRRRRRSRARSVR